MTGGAVLVVVPPPAGSTPGISPATPLAGLSLLGRIALAARAAGFERVMVRHGVTASDPALARAGAEVVGLADTPTIRGRRVVFVPYNVVPQARWLRALRETPLDAERLYVDPSMTAVVETKEPRRVISAAVRCSDAAALVTDLRATFKDVGGAISLDQRRTIAVPSDLEAAEEWLLHSLIKDTEGFMSRHFERRVSLALTRWLAWTSITPNAMTVVSLSIGVTGALFFLSSAPGWQLTGALLFLTHSILDGCDGELARLKFMQSRLGAILDFWGDNLVHVAVFGCIAVGWSLASGSLWPLLLGLIGDVAILASASLMFRRIAADNVKTPGGDVADFLAGALANRDFIYLVIVLAAFGKAKWLLILLVIGAPAFLALVLWRDYLRRS